MQSCIMEMAKSSDDIADSRGEDSLMISLVHICKSIEVGEVVGDHHLMHHNVESTQPRHGGSTPEICVACQGQISY